jgi:hypothetical protein
MMKVYFAVKETDRAQVKIGHAQSIERRLCDIARYVGPVRLLATIDGGVHVERNILAMFKQYRVEGEWFAFSEEIQTFIANCATPSGELYGAKKQAWETKLISTRRERDMILAGYILERAFEQFDRSVSIAEALEICFHRLSEIGDGWTRRRVRGLRERRDMRVDTYEIIDLLKLANIQKAEWIALLEFGAPAADEQAAA